MSTPQARSNAYEIGHGMVWAEGEGKTWERVMRKGGKSEKEWRVREREREGEIVEHLLVNTSVH